VKRKTLTYGDLLFDLKYGVDTCGQKSILDLDIDPSMKTDSISYEPSPVKVVRSILEALSITHPNFTFVDFGSGKGRVLLLASEYPYRRVIGVELSRRLHEIAEANIKKWKRLSSKNADVASVNMNALEFSLPEEPLVLFFFTPFLGSVFAEVVNKIRVNLQSSKHPVHIVYYGRNEENIGRLRDLGIDHKKMDLKNTFFATGKFEVHLFVKDTYEHS
jgi:SAM-dependent methyltransferase